MQASEMLEPRKFVAPEFIFGLDARHLAGRYAQNLGARKVLVVTDRGVIAAGWAHEVTESLEQSAIEYTVFANVTSNPRAEEVMNGVEVYQQEKCNFIIAVGGGSPMDCAKGIGISSSNQAHILEFEGVDEVQTPGPPLVCIPTTAGSAAEVSQFAIITASHEQRKIAIISKMVVPDAALIAPETTTTMDARLTAATGMDVLTHAVEAYVSNASSPITDLHALEAIRLVAGYLLSAIAHPDDLIARGKMMLASTHAGLAFSNASLGAVHAMAHSLGGYLDTPHGEANALLLRHVLAFNFEAVPERCAAIGEAMGAKLQGASEQTIKARLVEKIAALQEVAGVRYTLSSLGVRPDDIPTLAYKAMRDPCMATNPRRPTQKDIETIYEEAL